MSAHPVCSVTDIPPGTAHRVEVEGRPIAVVNTEGQWFAVSDICSHADVSLAEGDVDGCTLECWLHGSRFDLRTGRPSGPPATTPVPIYPVSVEGDTVFVTVA
jgi:3-phenylpropionate/trans-cinnamate dioxygenase ferredoxin subunit